MVKIDEDQALLSVFTVARLTDTKPSTWRKRIQRREIPFTRIGRCVRIPRSFVEKLIREGMREPITLDEPAVHAESLVTR